MSQYLAIGTGAAICVLLAIQAQRIIAGYRVATGTRWQRFLAAFSHSHTVLLARAGAFLAAASAWAVNFLPSLDPSTSLGQAVAGILKPEYSPYYALCFSLLVEVVRKWPASIDPVLPPAQAVNIPPSLTADEANK